MKLNPASEQKLVSDISDEEIFQAVQDMHEAEPMMEMNGGDDDDGAVNKKPTWKDALTAAPRDPSCSFAAGHQVAPADPMSQKHPSCTHYSFNHLRV